MDGETDNQETVVRSLYRIVSSLTRAMELRDHPTVQHQAEVADLARHIGNEMGLPPRQINSLRLGGTVHDIGKIGIPVEILAKPSKLSTPERVLVQQHSEYGAQILGNINSPWPLTDIVLQHHERLDGSGYPEGLKGDQIILEAQIVAVADVSAAMLVDRSYRKAVSRDRVIEALEEAKGRKLNTDAVDIIVQLLTAPRPGTARS